MNLLFTICARAGSTGVKDKNIRDFLGTPLSYYTLAAYKIFYEKYENTYETITLALNTDSEELHRQIDRTGIAFTFIQRKEALAGDIVSKIDVIKDTVKEMEKINTTKYDLIVDLDLTSPLRTAADISGTIKVLCDNEYADLAFSVTDARRLPSFDLVMLADDGSCVPVIKSDYVARQQVPEYYDMNASIYVYKNKFIASEKTMRLFDGKAVIFKMVDTAILEIDSEKDLELMQILARHFFDKHDEFGAIEKTAKSL